MFNTSVLVRNLEHVWREHTHTHIKRKTNIRIPTIHLRDQLSKLTYSYIIKPGGYKVNNK